MDDKRETTYARDLLRDVAQGSFVPSSFPQTLTETLFGMGKDWYAYIACFSTEIDSCQQWCDYADRGRGCALVVDSAKLHDGAPGSYALFPVLYDREEQRKRIKSTFDAARNVAERLGVDGEFEDGLEATLVKASLLTAVRLKCPEWSHQGEWRLLVLQPDRREAKFRSSKADSIPYLSVPFDHSLLRAIKAGPSADTATIKRILHEHGLEELPVILSQLDPRDCDCTTPNSKMSHVFTP